MPWEKSEEEKEMIAFTSGDNRLVIFKPLTTGKYKWEEGYWRITSNGELQKKQFKTKEDAVEYSKKKLMI